MQLAPGEGSETMRINATGRSEIWLRKSVTFRSGEPDSTGRFLKSQNLSPIWAPEGSETVRINATGPGASCIKGHIFQT